MNTIDAWKIVGNQPKWALRNMKQALESMTWLNTSDDWQRLEATYIVTKTPIAKRITP
jgi:hypothetical protein